MSRHYCDTKQDGTPVTVIMGYDRPLRFFHLTVERLGGETNDGSPPDTFEEGVIVYCNLYDDDLPRGECHHLDYYRKKLSELNIEVPDTVFRETERDAINNVGNRDIRHLPDGRMTVMPADSSNN